ncbi:MAG TPA: response regulator transcription factor [Spirochaetota bacterium]|nr:response regulator transcription factor [Spirochaetota bacterium]
MIEKDILIVDKDKQVCKLLQQMLEQEGYTVDISYNGRKALALIKDKEYSLILLETNLPELGGYDICRETRSIVSAPVLFLSNKTRNVDQIVGLEMGADDYICKPLDYDVLIAKIKAHLRREKRYALLKEKQTDSNVYLDFDQLKIRKNPFEAYYKGQKVDISTKECQILLLLAENKNKTLKREEINNYIWGPNEQHFNTISIHVMNIRKKMDVGKYFIKTIRGVGYKFTGKD